MKVNPQRVVSRAEIISLETVYIMGGNKLHSVLGTQNHRKAAECISEGLFSTFKCPTSILMACMSGSITQPKETLRVSEETKTTD